MIFNVNAAAVAALALTMAVHAAPSPVAHELKDLQDLQGCNDESGRASRTVVDANVLNHSDNDSHDESSRASRKDVEVNALNKSDDNARDESSRANRKDVEVNALNKSDDNARDESSRANRKDVEVNALNKSDNDSHDESSRTSRKDVEVNALNKSDDNSRDESSRASRKEVEVNALNKSDDNARDESSRANRKDVEVNALNKSDDDDSHRRTKDNSADVTNARNDDENRNNRRCDDCKSAFSQGGRVLVRKTGEVLSEVHQAVRHEVLDERCSPEEAAQRCGVHSNSIVAGYRGTRFNLFCFLNGITSVTDDSLLREWLKNGWEYQYHYDC
ncbi:hypothetical protein F5146DRAFT_701223 [Armillaria mellea]|nr:hypothetical protein F5146DRAFT_701223 [Armillaria mellea]